MIQRVVGDSRYEETTEIECPAQRFLLLRKKKISASRKSRRFRRCGRDRPISVTALRDRDFGHGLA